MLGGLKKWVFSFVSSSGSTKEIAKTPTMPQGAPLVTDGKTGSGVAPETVNKLITEINQQANDSKNREAIRTEAGKELQPAETYVNKRQLLSTKPIAGTDLQQWG